MCRNMPHRRRKIAARRPSMDHDSPAIPFRKRVAGQKVSQLSCRGKGEPRMVGIDIVLQEIGRKEDAGHWRVAKKVSGSIGEAAGKVCELYVTMQEGWLLIIGQQISQSVLLIYKE
jgi:hypothetical protein